MKKQLTALLLVLVMVLTAGCSKKLVEITIPADFMANAGAEELINEAKKSGVKEVVTNDDGSLTFKMDEKVQKSLLDELKAGLDEIIPTLTSGDTAIPSFQEITYNDTMTEFTVKCDAAAYSEAVTAYAVSFYIIGGMYQLFNNNDTSAIVINFVDSQTGDVLYTADSSAFGAE